MGKTGAQKKSYKNKRGYSPYTRRRRLRPFSKCEKYICQDSVTGEYTCGLLFLKSGKVRVGADVWRLSNPADCCDYPIRAFSSLDIAMQYFSFEIAPCSFHYAQNGENRQDS